MNKKELHAKEFEYQQLFDVNMNTYSATSGVEYNDPDYKKKYYEKHLEKISEKNREYRKENREKLNQKSKEKVECECGCILNKSTLSRHRKTPRHAKLMSC